MTYALANHSDGQITGIIQVGDINFVPPEGQMVIDISEHSNLEEIVSNPRAFVIIGNTIVRKHPA
jgi:hypothetical protein